MKNYYVVYVDSIGEVGEVLETYEEANEYHSKWLNDLSSAEDRTHNSYIIELHTINGNIVGNETVMVWEGDNV